MSDTSASYSPADRDLASIADLIEDPARAANLGRQAALSCERRFHPNVIARRFVEYYSQVVRERGPQAKHHAVSLIPRDR